MAIQYTEDFKKGAVTCWKEHLKLGISKCAKNLGISKSELSTWGKSYDANEGAVPTRGCGNPAAGGRNRGGKNRGKLKNILD